MTKATVDAQRLEIRRARETDQTELAAFECGDDDLNGFLRDDALRLQQRNTVLPALKIARLATAKAFRETTGGLGTMLMRLAVARGYEIADAAGCRLLTLDAYPEAIAFYERLGFLRNKAKPYREREHPSMRFDLFAPDVPGWL